MCGTRDNVLQKSPGTKTITPVLKPKLWEPDGSPCKPLLRMALFVFFTIALSGIMLSSSFNMESGRYCKMRKPYRNMAVASLKVRMKNDV
jgi:hypothetical protein